MKSNGFLCKRVSLHCYEAGGGARKRRRNEGSGEGKKERKIWVGWRWRGEHCPDRKHRTGRSPGVATSRQGHPHPSHLIPHPWRAPPQICISTRPARLPSPYLTWQLVYLSVCDPCHVLGNKLHLQHTQNRTGFSLQDTVLIVWPFGAMNGARYTIGVPQIFMERCVLFFSLICCCRSILFPTLTAKEFIFIFSNESKIFRSILLKARGAEIIH